jgi:sarcosine oxidase
MSLWRDLAKYQKATSDDAPLLSEVGAIMIGAPDSNLIKGTLESIRVHSLPSTTFTADELHARFPCFCPSRGEVGVYEAEAGLLVPEACLDWHLRQAAEHGAEMHYNERFVSWEASSLANEDGPEPGRGREQVIVRTDKGHAYRCGTLILAVGPWAPALYGAEIPLLLRTERRVLFWIKPSSDVSEFKVRPLVLLYNIYIVHNMPL